MSGDFVSELRTHQSLKLQVIEEIVRLSLLFQYESELRTPVYIENGGLSKTRKLKVSKLSKPYSNHSIGYLSGYSFTHITESGHILDGMECIELENVDSDIVLEVYDHIKKVGFELENNPKIKLQPYRSGGFLNRDCDMGRITIELPILDANKLLIRLMELLNI